MAKGKAGRPSIYTPELANDFLEAYSQGISVTEICSWEGMPDRMTLFRWRQKNEDFATAYAQARKANAESIEDRMSDIERQVMDGTLEPQAANVVLASQRWRARVLHPQQYGDKVDLTTGGKQMAFAIQIDLGK